MFRPIPIDYGMNIGRLLVTFQYDLITILRISMYYGIDQYDVLWE